jgi:catechol 2,3-dioxygenase-like lactoylglutathione lyase family enzyme
MKKLAFLYQPVSDLKRSLAFYEDLLGFEVAWREGETTAGLKIPETPVRIMLDVDDGMPGPVFEVESVDGFYTENRDRFTWVQAPVDIPGGRWAIFLDPDEKPVRVLDESRP